MTRRVLHLASPQAMRSLTTALHGSSRELAAEFVQHVAIVGRSAASAPVEIAGCTVSRVTARGALDPLAAWRLRQTCREFAPDVVHVWEDVPALVMLLSGGAAATRLVVDVAAVLRTTAGSDLPRWRNAAARQLAKRADAIVTPNLTWRAAAQTLGLTRPTWHVIPSPISPPTQPLSRAQLRHALAIPADAAVVAALGPLIPALDLKEILWAFDLFVTLRPGAHLIVLGTGPLQASLQDFAAGQPSAAAMHFVTGPESLGAGPQATPSDVLAACDQLWSAQRTLSPPAGVLDALAAGIPVLALDQPSTRELLPAEALAPSGDRIPWATAAVRQLKQPIAPVSPPAPPSSTSSLAELYR